MTEHKLADELAALDAKATPGPWRVGGQIGANCPHLIDMGKPPKAPYVMFYEGNKFSGPRAVAHTDGPANERDASVRLIVALRNNLPAILAALRRPSFAEGVEAAAKVADAAEAAWDSPTAAMLRIASRATPAQAASGAAAAIGERIRQLAPTPAPAEDALRAALTLADAFEMGCAWQQSLTGQTIEDSRAVGRTLYSNLFEPIKERIVAIIDSDGFDSFQDADGGIYQAKRIIRTALSEGSGT